MTDRPIIFSAPMVRALLTGTKTQTRRTLKPQPDMAKIGQPCHPEPRGACRWVWMARDDRPDYQYATADFLVRFAVGDRLWVRETWQHAPQKYCTCPQGSEPAPCDDWSNGTGCRSNRGDVVYRADKEALTGWHSAIFMPRWASRLTLTVTDVRVQRLQDITEEDAKAEGVALAIAGQGDDGAIRIRTHRTGFVGVWQEINGNWLDNPWVVALTFSAEQRNIDSGADHD